MQLRYWTVIFIIYLLYIVLKIYEINLNKKVGRIDPEIIERYCDNMFLYYNINPIEIECGKYFSYNKMKKIITVRDLENYNILDLFICFHEIGHYVFDTFKYVSKINNFLIIIFLISRVFITPCLMFFGVYFIIQNHIYISKDTYLYINIIYFIISAIRMISIPFTEGAANYYAKKFMTNTQIAKIYEDWYEIINKSCIIAQLNQELVCILFVYINFSLFFCVFFNL